MSESLIDVIERTSGDEILQDFNLDEDVDWDQMEWWFAAADNLGILKSEVCERAIDVCRNRDDHPEARQKAVIMVYDLKMESEFGKSYPEKIQA